MADGKVDFLQWVGKVAPHIGSKYMTVRLPDGEMDSDGPRYVELIDAPGGSQGIHFYRAWKSDRAEISGVWPRQHDGQYPYLSNGEAVKITVSMVMNPAMAAGHIKRRFLPQYEEVYCKVLQRVEQGTEAHRVKTEILERLRAAQPALELPAHPVRGEYELHGYSSYRGYPQEHAGISLPLKGYWSHIKVKLTGYLAGDLDVKLEIDGLAPEVAERILRGLL